MRSSRPTLSRGFTLVEMLVVIVIIGILTAILVPTVMAAIRRAKIGAMALEVKDLETALAAYKDANNDYPPDGTNVNAVKAHFRIAYQRITNHNAYINAWWSAGGDKLDPAEALVYFLSQTRNDVRDPLGTNGEVRKYFDFQETRLRDDDGDGFNEYYPPSGDEAPYVYFDGRTMTTATGPTVMYVTAAFPKTNGDPRISQLGRIRPFQTNSSKWIEPNKYQLFCAGLDSHFGVDDSTSGLPVPKQFPDPNYYQQVPTADRKLDEDNITSFSEGQTLGDHFP